MLIFERIFLSCLGVGIIGLLGVCIGRIDWIGCGIGV